MTGLQGSGKTLAFGLPIIQALVQEKAFSTESEHGEEGENSGTRENNDERNKDTQKLRALILAPTRELAIQVRPILPIGIRVVYIAGIDYNQLERQTDSLPSERPSGHITADFKSSQQNCPRARYKGKYCLGQIYV